MKNKFFTLAVSAVALCATTSFAQSIAPTRVGPVSEYGELLAGKNSSNEGRIYGSCKGVVDGAEVQVRGMSLYWSLLADATDFWTETAVTSMLNDMNIQLIRASMATGTEDWGGPYKGYQLDAENQKKLVSTIVETAIKLDIYVIIDWHSHEATNQVESAKGFFSEMAKKYGSYDNVIFELFNEPLDIAWDEIKNYANQVIPAIREYSDNLILVGNRAWDQHPEEVIGNEVTDSKNNTAYTLHYYAMSHCASGTNEYGGPCEGANGEKAIKAGLPIFLSEWGVGTADGNGTTIGREENDEWQAFANKYKISWANWSASRVDELASAFTKEATASDLQYSASGKLIKEYLSSNPTTYTACQTESDTSKTGFAKPFQASRFELNVSENSILLLNARNPSIQLYDVQGHSLRSTSSGFLSLENLPNGMYVVKANDGGQSQMHSIRIAR